MQELTAQLDEIKPRNEKLTKDNKCMEKRLNELELEASKTKNDPNSEEHNRLQVKPDPSPSLFIFFIKKYKRIILFIYLVSFIQRFFTHLIKWRDKLNRTPIVNLLVHLYIITILINFQEELNRILRYV